MNKILNCQNTNLLYIGGAVLTLVNCVLRDFATAINCKAAATITITDCIINGSGTAIGCSDIDDFKLTLIDTVISDSKRYGILVTSLIENTNATKKITYESIDSAR